MNQQQPQNDLNQHLLPKSLPYQTINFDADHHSTTSDYTSSSNDPEIYTIPDIDVQQGAVKRLITVSVVCLLLMLGKLVGGLIANSLAILTDAAHMFSDLSGFLISLVSLYIARRPANTQMSYGYHRAEVIGAMASVILIWGLTVWLITEATERIIKMDYEINGLIMMITAIAGFLTNVLMFRILHSDGHGHSHGGQSCPSSHSHSHGHGNEKKLQLKIQDLDFAEDEGLNDVEKEKNELDKLVKKMKKQKKDGHGHSHGHSNKQKEDKEKKQKIKQNIELQNEPQMSGEGDNEQFLDESPNQNEHQHPECEQKKHKKKEHHDHDDHNQEEEEESHSQRSESNLSIIEESDNPNLRAAWIHMLGDTISSFGAVIASIIIFKWQSMKIVDPICTYFFAILVLLTTLPISRDCILVLMEGTPVGISVDDFEKELKQIKGVSQVHDIHIWQLSAGKPSMSCHIIAKDVNFVLKKATRICRKKGIYHSTIQIEDIAMANQVDAIKCEQNIH